MKYPAIFAFTIGCSCLVFPHLGNAGGYAEPILAPEVIRPMPRPSDECQRFLFWIVCDAENPSPKREREDAQERPADKDTPADRPARDPAPVGEADRPEPPAAPETPVVDTPQKPPEPPVDGGDDTPTKDDTPGQNPGNDKPVGKSKWDGKRGEQPSGKDK